MKALLNCCMAAVFVAASLMGSYGHTAQELIVQNEAQLIEAIETINTEAGTTFIVRLEEDISLTQDLPPIAVAKSVGFIADQKTVSGVDLFKTLLVADGVTPFIGLVGAQFIESPEIDLGAAEVGLEVDAALHADIIRLQKGWMFMPPDQGDVSNFGESGFDLVGTCGFEYFSEASDTKEIQGDINLVPEEGHSPKGLVVFFSPASAESEQAGLLVLSGNISGTGAVLVDVDEDLEGATLRLAGNANSYSTGTKVKKGRLQLLEGSGVGTGVIRMLAGAQLEQMEFNDLKTLNNNLALDCGSSECDKDVELIVTGQETALALNGTIYEVELGKPVRLSKAGLGLLKLAGENEWSGGLLVAEGALELQTDAALGAGSIELAPGVTLQLSSNGGKLDINNEVLFTLAQQGQETAAVVRVDDGDGLLSGDLRTVSAAADNQSLLAFTKMGEDTLFISGANQDLSGEITIAEGSLALSGEQASLGEATVAIEAGALLVFDGDSYTMTEANQISLQNTLDTEPCIKLLNDAMVTILAPISGNGNLYVVGDALNTPEHDALLIRLLSPENSYSGGATVVERAQLEVHSGALATSDLQLKDKAVVRWGDAFALVDKDVALEDAIYLDPNGLNVVAPTLLGEAESVTYSANSANGGYITFWQDVPNLVASEHFIVASGATVTLNNDQVLAFVKGSGSPATFKKVIGGTVSVESPSADEPYELDFDADSEITSSSVVVSGGAILNIKDGSPLNMNLVNVSVQEQAQLVLNIAAANTVAIQEEFSLARGAVCTQSGGGALSVISPNTMELQAGSELLIEDGLFSANSVVANLDVADSPAQIINEALGSIEIAALVVSGGGQLDIVNRRDADEGFSFFSVLDLTVDGSFLRADAPTAAARIEVDQLTLASGQLIKDGEGRLLAEQLIGGGLSQLEILQGNLEVDSLDGGTFVKQGPGLFVINQGAALTGLFNMSGSTTIGGQLELAELGIDGGALSVAGDLTLSQKLSVSGTLSAAADMSLLQGSEIFINGTGSVAVVGSLASSATGFIYPAATLEAQRIAIDAGTLTVAGGLSANEVVIASGAILNLSSSAAIDANSITIDPGGVFRYGTSFSPPPQAFGKLTASEGSTISGSINQLGLLETFAPLTIEGDLSQALTAVTVVHVTPTRVGTIRVLGQASLGGLLQIHSEECQAPEGVAKIPILIADGGIEGGFAGTGFVPDECAELFKVIADPSGVFLINIAAISFADTACSCAQRCMLQALTEHYLEHTPGPLLEFIENVLVPLPRETADCVWRSLMAESYADLLPLGIYSARLTASSIQKQLWRSHDVWLQPDSERHIWADGFVQNWKQSPPTCSELSGWRGVGASFDVGGDYRIGTHGLLGLAVNLQRSHGKLSELDARLHYSNYGASLYGSWLSHDLYVDGQIGGGYTRSEVQRRICIEDYKDCVGSTLDGGRMQGRLEVGWIKHHYGGGVQPFVALEGACAGIGRFDEGCQSPIALFSCSAVTDSALYAEAGVRLFTVWQKQGWILQPEADLRYAYNLAGGRYKTDVGWVLADSCCCCFDGLKAVRNIVTLTMGAVAQVGESVQLALRFNGQLGSQRWQSAGANLQVSYAF